jgi:chemotaxis response regulator CheB
VRPKRWMIAPVYLLSGYTWASLVNVTMPLHSIEGQGIMNGIVVIAASAGGHDPLFRIIAALPVLCTAAVFVVTHIGPHPSVL